MLTTKLPGAQAFPWLPAGPLALRS